MNDFLQRLLGRHPDQQEIDEKKEEILRAVQNVQSRLIPRKKPEAGPHAIVLPDRVDPSTPYKFNRYSSYTEALEAARELFGADPEGRICIIVKE